MLHWAISFGTMALIAAVFALSGAPLVVLGVAQLLFWLNAALFVLALVTGAFGRGRDGLYSSERALGAVGLTAAAACFGYAWVKHDWTAEDAGRALDRGAVQLAQTTEAVWRALPRGSDNDQENHQERDDRYDGRE